MYVNDSHEKIVKKQIKEFNLICLFKYAINCIVSGRKKLHHRQAFYTGCTKYQLWRQMLLPRREIKWSEKYKLRPLLSRLVGALQATLLTNKEEKQQQMENKWRRTKKEVKTEFTTAVMLLPARLRQFNGSLICFCDPAIVSAYIQSSKTSGSLELFFLRRRCHTSITLFHKLVKWHNQTSFESI